ncbi:MAG TPA: methyltransferase domain-containing protein [Intrasporangiaceae bacterium]|nr:methyltransferase domain-containing protein [Intrasporangiaceae bacterium]
MNEFVPATTVEEAMRRAPRADYLPESVRMLAHEDRPLSIGDGATNSQPSTVRLMIDLLDVRPGHRVLDVGSGSGWTTAILAHLVGPTGSVLGVELIERLVRESSAALEAAGLHHTSVRVAQLGALGAPDAAPFDRILVSAEARRLPRDLVDQLADGGILVTPVKDRMVIATRRGDDVDIEYGPGRFRFVPLR